MYLYCCLVMLCRSITSVGDPLSERIAMISSFESTCFLRDSAVSIISIIVSCVCMYLAGVANPRSINATHQLVRVKNFHIGTRPLPLSLSLSDLHDLLFPYSFSSMFISKRRS